MPVNMPTGAKRGTPIAPQVACNCGSLRKASRRVSQFYDMALSPMGIKSTQFAILTEIERGSVARCFSLCELAAAMVMDRSTLGHNVRPLQRDALLTLRQATDDRRKRYVEITPKGAMILSRSREIWQRAETRFEEIFGERPAAELRAVLLTIASNPALKSYSGR